MDVNGQCKVDEKINSRKEVKELRDQVIAKVLKNYNSCTVKKS